MPKKQVESVVGFLVLLRMVPGVLGLYFLSLPGAMSDACRMLGYIPFGRFCLAHSLVCLADSIAAVISALGLKHKAVTPVAPDRFGGLAPSTRERTAFANVWSYSLVTTAVLRPIVEVLSLVMFAGTYTLAYNKLVREEELCLPELVRFAWWAYNVAPFLLLVVGLLLVAGVRLPPCLSWQKHPVAKIALGQKPASVLGFVAIFYVAPAALGLHYGPLLTAASPELVAFGRIPFGKLCLAMGVVAAAEAVFAGFVGLLLSRAHVKVTNLYAMRSEHVRMLPLDLVPALAEGHPALNKAWSSSMLAAVLLRPFDVVLTLLMVLGARHLTRSLGAEAPADLRALDWWLCTAAPRMCLGLIALAWLVERFLAKHRAG